jgi:hypothetical protein
VRSEAAHRFGRCVAKRIAKRARETLGPERAESFEAELDARRLKLLLVLNKIGEGERPGYRY